MKINVYPRSKKSSPVKDYFKKFQRPLAFIGTYLCPLVSTSLTIPLSKSFPFPVFIIVVTYFTDLSFVEIEPVVISLPVNKSLRAPVIEPAIGITTHRKAGTWAENERYMGVVMGTGRGLVLATGTATGCAANNDH
jgi:hypothetical protein